MENKIAERRKEMHLTQEQLSELSGVPRSTIAEIEKGARTPRVDIAIMLATALEMPVDDLFIL